MGLESKIEEVHSISPSPLYWVENFQSKILKTRFCPQNVNVVITIQFLAILLKIPLHTSWNQTGNPEKGESEKRKSARGNLKEFLPQAFA